MIHLTRLVDLPLLAETASSTDDSVLSDWYPGLFLVVVIVFAYSIWRKRKRKPAEPE